MQGISSASLERRHSPLLYYVVRTTNPRRGCDCDLGSDLGGNKSRLALRRSAARRGWDSEVRRPLDEPGLKGWDRRADLQRAAARRETPVPFVEHCVGLCACARVDFPGGAWRLTHETQWIPTGSGMDVARWRAVIGSPQGKPGVVKRLARVRASKLPWSWTWGEADVG